MMTGGALVVQQSLAGLPQGPRPDLHPVQVWDCVAGLLTFAPLNDDFAPTTNVASECSCCCAGSTAGDGGADAEGPAS